MTKPPFPVERVQGFPEEIFQALPQPKEFQGCLWSKEGDKSIQLEDVRRSSEGSGRHRAEGLRGKGRRDPMLTLEARPRVAGRGGDDLSRLFHVPANQSRILASESRTLEAGGDASQ